jgi:hypothetical protein
VPSLTTKTHPNDQNKSGEADALQAAEWRRWAHTLKRLGLAKFAITFLEAGSAFATLAAQALYMSQPLLDPWRAKEPAGNLAALLESPAESSAFAQLLREEPQ